MEFHISRTVREKLDVDGLLFSYTGNVIFGDVAASRKLASQLNKLAGRKPIRQRPSMRAPCLPWD